MSSDKQIAANQANAIKSCGPKTLVGKARSKPNALRHGLSIPVGRDPTVAAMIAEFACELVGSEAQQTEMNLAWAAAEAQFDIARIREKRDCIFNQHVENQVSPDPSALKILLSLDRYEKRATSRRRKALRRLAHLQKLPMFG